MAEYIDTSTNPEDYIEVWEVEDAEHGKQRVMAVDDLKCLPPADVRPVVFCKDCAKAKTDTVDGAIYCRVWDMWEMPEKGFCFNGVKKKGGDAE